jgi:hypothetical protein
VTQAPGPAGRRDHARDSLAGSGEAASEPGTDTVTGSPAPRRHAETGRGGLLAAEPAASQCHWQSLRATVTNLKNDDSDYTIYSTSLKQPPLAVELQVESSSAQITDAGRWHLRERGKTPKQLKKQPYLTKTIDGPRHAERNVTHFSLTTGQQVGQFLEKTKKTLL